MSVYQTIVRNTYWSALSTVGGLLMGLITNIVLARALGAPLLGQYNYWLWLIGLLALVASPGLPQAMTKFGAEYLGRPERETASAIFARLLRIELVLGSIVGGTVLIYSLVVPSSDTAALALVAFSVMLVVVEVFFQAAAKGAQDFRIFSQASLIGGLLFGAAAITLVSIGYGIYPLLLAYIGRRILTILLIGWKLPNHYTVRGLPTASIPPELRQRILRYSRDIVLIFATSTIPYERFGVFFLKLFATDVDIAFYSQSFDLAIKSMAIPAIFTATLLPTFSSLQGQNDIERIGRVYISSNRVAAAVAMPIGLGGAAVAASVALLYGPEFLGMAPILAIFFVGNIGGSIASVSVAMLHSAEEQNYIVRLNAVMALCNIVLSLLLVPSLGATGAALATCGCHTVSSAMSIAHAARRLQVDLPFRILGRVFFAALSAAIAAWLISTWLGGLVVAVAAAVLIYPVMLRTFAALDASDQELLTRLSQHVPQGLAPAYQGLVQFLVRS
ncbi:MAG: oligosaccharide flippase family protein [Caldilineaceae bacterium]|nr:oligosaccharide flippase family protein [Caldilineaceae bacterium]